MLLPDIPYSENSVIPKIIHQTYGSRNLPEVLQQNVERLKAFNPTWEYRFYDDEDIKNFILNTYGTEVFIYYERINASYTAAKADLFRYLLIYACGGIYLDIKSSFSKPIDDVLLPDDQYLLSNWCNRPGEKYEAFGMHKEVEEIPGGEYQQWHVISCAGHPFLKAVIERVLQNIDNYKPWIHGVGRKGVLALTGPIVYTTAIHPLLNLYKHRKVRTHDELGLIYSLFNLSNSHYVLYSRPHYTTLNASIVKQSGFNKVAGDLYTLVLNIRKILSRLKAKV